MFYVVLGVEHSHFLCVGDTRIIRLNALQSRGLYSLFGLV